MLMAAVREAKFKEQSTALALSVLLLFVVVIVCHLALAHSDHFLELILVGICC